MPGNILTIDTSMPDLARIEGTDNQINAIQNYLYMLLEELRYLLRNLSPENFNEAETLDWIGRNIKAETVISNTVITNELYADYGAVADLTVWKLRTDYERAYRYLNENTAPLDYIYIHNEEIEFWSDTIHTEDDVPVTDPIPFVVDGRTFYWTDESQTQMTCQKETLYPVYVYQYDSLLKATIRFQNVTEGGVTTKIPTLVLGAGYGDWLHPDRGKGFLRKNTNSLDLWLHNSAGVNNGLFIGDAYTDIAGLRKPIGLNFADWDNGFFAEVLDGNVLNTFEITFDELDTDLPVKFTDSTGHETVVNWT